MEWEMGTQQLRANEQRPTAIIIDKKKTTNFYVQNETTLRVHNNANRDSYNITILSEWVAQTEFQNLLNF